MRTFALLLLSADWFAGLGVLLYNYFVQLMHTVSYSEARATLAALLDQVTDDQEAIVISRRGKKPVALVPLDELESYRETAYLLRSPANTERLLAALNRADRGEGQPMTVAELEQHLKLHERPAS